MMGGILANNSSGMCCGVRENAYHTLDSLALRPARRHCRSTPPIRRRRPAARRRPGAARRACSISSGGSRPIRTLAARIRASTGSRTPPATRSTPSSTSTARRADPGAPADRLGRARWRSSPRRCCGRSPSSARTQYTGLLLFPTAARRLRGDRAAASARARARSSSWTARACARSRTQPRDLARSSRGRFPPTAPRRCSSSTRRRRRTSWRASAQPRRAAVRRRSRCSAPARFTDEPAEQAALWKMRKGLFPSVGATKRSGETVIIEDVAFPLPNGSPTRSPSLQALFDRHGYADAIIFGHAKDGNLHFVLTQAFNDAAEVDRYDALHGRPRRAGGPPYDGSLKAEHGTGRNMAPFVEAEWGAEAYGDHARVKALLDPDGLLNPGVILNADPRAHVTHLKDLPTVDAEVDRCIECGFCEPRCPSRRPHPHAAPAHRRAARDGAAAGSRAATRAATSRARCVADYRVRGHRHLRRRRPLRHRLPGEDRHRPPGEAPARRAPRGPRPPLRRLARRSLPPVGAAGPPGGPRRPRRRAPRRTRCGARPGERGPPPLRSPAACLERRHSARAACSRSSPPCPPLPSPSRRPGEGGSWPVRNALAKLLSPLPGEGGAMGEGPGVRGKRRRGLPRLPRKAPRRSICRRA